MVLDVLGGLGKGICLHVLCRESGYSCGGGIGRSGYSCGGGRGRSGYSCGGGRGRSGYSCGGGRVRSLTPVE